jgi:hypothetical protein
MALLWAKRGTPTGRAIGNLRRLPEVNSVVLKFSRGRKLQAWL